MSTKYNTLANSSNVYLTINNKRILRTQNQIIVCRFERPFTKIYLLLVLVLFSFLSFLFSEIIVVSSVVNINKFRLNESSSTTSVVLKYCGMIPFHMYRENKFEIYSLKPFKGSQAHSHHDTELVVIL